MRCRFDIDMASATDPVQPGIDALAPTLARQLAASLYRLPRSTPPRNWEPDAEVWLNPPKKHQVDKGKKLKAA